MLIIPAEHFPRRQVPAATAVPRFLPQVLWQFPVTAFTMVYVFGWQRIAIISELPTRTKPLARRTLRVRRAEKLGS